MASPATVVRRSENRKLSTDKKVNATYVSQITCPKTCPFKNNGCYAECGPIAYTTKRLNDSKETRPSMVARHEARLIRQLDAQFPLRAHVLGDCKDEKSARILSEACFEYSSKFNQKVWCYTHTRTIPREAWGNISILRSCESLRQAEVALNANFGVAMTVPKFKSKKRYAMPGRGLHGIPCPVQTGLAKSCVDCKLCLNLEGLIKRRYIILFEAHGTGKNAVIRAIEK